MSRTRLPTWRQIAAVELYTICVAWGLTSLTRQPFLDGVLHMIPLSLAQLLAFCAAGAWRPSWLPQSLARLLYLSLITPPAALAIIALPRIGRASAYLGKSYGLASVIALTLIGLIFGLLFASVALYLQRKARERAAERERIALERDLLDARLRLLQAQIEPHFLFNTLANVLALVESGSPRAAPVLRHLIAYLRAAMPRLEQTQASLEQELQLVRAYLELMCMRMPDRLQFKLDAAAELLSLPLPPMLLLTLVENAVKHGIDPAMHGGMIEVGAQRQDGRVLLWVADNGVGLSESAQPGAGLTNLKARLQACYGAQARLELLEVAPHGLRVELHFDDKQALCP
ncbi:histidine kinase [Massilia sp. W12]|uniref:sensor histidine kinase n=1 Tax=Massilia sp. W12 TaxID=3126507 RepID=UPI0030CFD1CF